MPQKDHLRPILTLRPVEKILQAGDDSAPLELPPRDVLIIFREGTGFSINDLQYSRRNKLIKPRSIDMPSSFSRTFAGGRCFVRGYRCNGVLRCTGPTCGAVYPVRKVVQTCPVCSESLDHETSAGCPAAFFIFQSIPVNAEPIIFGLIRTNEHSHLEPQRTKPSESAKQQIAQAMNVKPFAKPQALFRGNGEADGDAARKIHPSLGDRDLLRRVVRGIRKEAKPLLLPDGDLAGPPQPLMPEGSRDEREDVSDLLAQSANVPQSLPTVPAPGITGMPLAVEPAVPLGISLDVEVASRKNIGTHDGQFHADDALAVFLVRNLPGYEGAAVHRTRDPQVLSGCDAVLDVGKVYDPATMRFDHHQPEFAETFTEESTIPLSSAGLVYRHFGRNILSTLGGAESSEELEALYQKTYKFFVAAIDAVDNGIQQYEGASKPRYDVTTTLSARVSRLNPPWTGPASPESANTRFEDAVQLVGSEFLDSVGYLKMVWLPARLVIQAAFDPTMMRQYDPLQRIIVFETPCTWKNHLLELEARAGTGPRTLYAVYPSPGDQTWRVQCVPGATSFESRLPLPLPWRGKDNDELSLTTGIQDCVFVHRSGFIGGNKARHGAIQMAQYALVLCDTGAVSPKRQRTTE